MFYFYNVFMNIKILSILFFTIYLLLFCTSTKAELNKITIGLNEDLYVEEGYPDVLTWNQGNLYLGWDNLFNKERNRIFVNYSFNALINKEILPNDITSVKLNLYQYYSQSINNYEIYYGEAINPWSQYLMKWNNPQNILSTEYKSNFSTEIGWKTLDISEIYIDQYKDSKLNGIVISSLNEYTPGGIFWSSNCLTDRLTPFCETNQLPYIEVEYKQNTSPTPPEFTQPTFIYPIATSTVNFIWNISTDFENDEITYVLEISTSLEMNNIIFSTSTVNNYYEYQVTNDGLYFARITAQDSRIIHKGVSYSNINIIEIDRIAPEVPSITPEPPYTYGDTNYISWDFDPKSENHQINFIIQVSTSSDFSTIIEEIITQNISINFSNLFDGKYFYRVKSKDIANNESNWSETVSSIQDSTSPQIKNFSINETFISPKESIDIKDTTEIKFTILEENLETWKLDVFNTEIDNICSLKGTSTNEIISFPVNFSTTNFFITGDCKDFVDGYYFLQLKALDLSGIQTFSDFLILQIDNTSPALPLIIQPTSNFLSKEKSILLSISSEKNSNNIITINNTNKIQYSGSIYSSKVSESLQNGNNTIEIFSTDRAGNYVLNNYSFELDWIKPETPKLMLFKEGKSLFLSAISNEAEEISIYNSAGVQEKIPNNIGKIKIADEIIPEIKYLYYGISRDKAGNISEKSLPVEYQEQYGIGDVEETSFKANKTNQKLSCLYKYNSTNRTLSRQYCSFPNPILEIVENKEVSELKYNVITAGGWNPQIDIEIKSYHCKKKTILDINTWFGCKEILDSTTHKNFTTLGSILTKIDNKSYSPYIRTTINDTSFITKTQHSQNYFNKNISIFSEIYLSVKINDIWLDIIEKSEYSNSKIIPEASKYVKPKYFNFPFSKTIGVTQWHGYTAFQSPHTGIDFASYYEPIYSPADGYISATGWDNYYGNCLSGGNYLKINHDNGMYTVYFHIENYKKNNGQNWLPGERVKKGDQIGVTGNTGYYNCQPLGYHLHFELREFSWQSSHLNPVPYIEYDWSKVETVGEEYSPGRLSGDNPHPNY